MRCTDRHFPDLDNAWEAFRVYRKNACLELHTLLISAFGAVFPTFNPCLVCR
jgi:hypothetical protein